MNIKKVIIGASVVAASLMPAGPAFARGQSWVARPEVPARGQSWVALPESTRCSSATSHVWCGVTHTPSYFWLGFDWLTNQLKPQPESALVKR